MPKAPNTKALYEIKSEKFSENAPAKLAADNEYRREPGINPGLVLIFNQVHFRNTELETRVGSNLDVDNIVSTLGKLGYNINLNDIFNDYDRDKILKKKKELVENRNTPKSNCLIVIFLTHGAEKDVLHTNFGTVTVQDMVTDFSNWDLGHPDKRSTPKLFIFQACKSSKITGTESGNNHFTVSLALPQDVVVYFSTVEGKVSIRNTEKGTWVIEELCKILLMYGKSEDVLNLLHRTNKCVAALETTSETKDGRIQHIKQMPVIMSTLTKKFYLTNSKEKRNIDAIVDSTVKQKEEIERLKQKLATIAK